MTSDGSDAIAFAEKALALLDQGAVTATYKYAVLLALIDVCLEGADERGSAPTRVHPRALAERIVELYWPHTAPFGGHGHDALVLRQNRGGQAEIVQLVGRFRQEAESGGRATLAYARRAAPNRYASLVDDVAWKLAQMPLPRLQRFGQTEDRFLYDLDWDTGISRRRFQEAAMDSHLRLRPGVGDHLVRLAGLLRPLVQRKWAEHVIALNRLRVPALDQQDDLDQFLFGSARANLRPVRDDLRDLQGRACFYCGDRLPASAEVDHFLPWSRHADDGIHNLVVAHQRCNNRKRDFLAAAPHVTAWTRRFRDRERDLRQIATARHWPHHPERTLSVARAVYLRLPGDARLWLSGDEFAPADRPALASALGTPDPLGRAAEAPGEYRPDERA